MTEYKVETFTGDGDALEKLFNDYAKQNWKLHSVSLLSADYFTFLVVWCKDSIPDQLKRLGEAEVAAMAPARYTFPNRPVVPKRTPWWRRRK
jgi:hypothetical protein